MTFNALSHVPTILCLNDMGNQTTGVSNSNSRAFYLPPDITTDDIIVFRASLYNSAGGTITVMLGKNNSDGAGNGVEYADFGTAVTGSLPYVGAAYDSMKSNSIEIAVTSDMVTHASGGLCFAATMVRVGGSGYTSTYGIQLMLVRRTVRG